MVKLGLEQIEAVILFIGIFILDKLSNIPEIIAVIAIDNAEIIELHHNQKKDAPSGTALMLAKSAAAGRGVPLDEKAIYGRHGDVGERPRGEIAVHALRGGSVVGDHTVMFASELERIELTHKAQDRAAFAAGALKALVWAKGRASGIYTMRHVLGFA